MKLIARFFNKDGVEMPALYLDEQGHFMCMWNFTMAERTEWADDAGELTRSGVRLIQEEDE